MSLTSAAHGSPLAAFVSRSPLAVKITPRSAYSTPTRFGIIWAFCVARSTMSSIPRASVGDSATMYFARDRRVSGSRRSENG
jgi:hypothetical protein